MNTEMLEDLMREIEKHAVLRSHAKLVFEARKELREVILLSELEVSARKWRAGINANRDKWTLKRVKEIQAAGREMYRVMDELDLLRTQKNNGGF